MPTMDEILLGLEPLLDDFDAITRAGFAAYQSYPAERVVEHDQRAAAACRYVHMRAEAFRRLNDRPGVVAKNIRGLDVWIIRDAAVVRLKQMDEDGLVAAYPTAQTEDYFDRDAELPELPGPAPRLSVGYLLDPTGSVFIRTQVARQDGLKRTEWCAAIVPADERAPGARRWTDVTRQRRLIA